MVYIAERVEIVALYLSNNERVQETPRFFTERHPSKNLSHPYTINLITICILLA